MGYKKALSVFIDILGTKNSDFDALLSVNKIFHNELIRIKGNQMLCKKYVSSFSDCAYIIYNFNEYNGDDKTAFHLYIHEALVDIAYTVSAILLDGFLCRGGITYGELYYKESKNFLFGPAINEAYKLENEAIMPRIVIDDKIGYDYYQREGGFCKHNENFRRLIRKDIFDNRYYLNYLYAFSQFDDDVEYFDEKITLGDREYNFFEFHSILINNSSNLIDNEKDYKIIAKHNWQLRYLNQHKKERENYFN